MRRVGVTPYLVGCRRDEIALPLVAWDRVAIRSRPDAAGWRLVRARRGSKVSAVGCGALCALCLLLGCGSAESRARGATSASVLTSPHDDLPALSFDARFARARRALDARRDAEALELVLSCIDRRGEARSGDGLRHLTIDLPEVVAVLSRHYPLARRLIGEKVASLGEVVLRGPSSESILGPPSDRELPSWLVLNLYLRLTEAVGDPLPSIAVLERCAGPPRCFAIGELATALVDVLVERNRQDLVAQLAEDILDHHLGVPPTPDSVVAWNARLETLAPTLHFALLTTGHDEQARALADRALRARPRATLFAALVASARKAGAFAEAARIRGSQAELDRNAAEADGKGAGSKP